jgi:hypothetical protein
MAKILRKPSVLTLLICLILVQVVILLLPPLRWNPVLGAPAAYTLSATPPAVNSLSATHAGFTISSTCATGTGYNYTVATSGGTQTLSGTGLLSGGTQTVTGINVSALPAGTLTYSASLEDSSGTGTAATATANWNPSAGLGYATGQTANDPFTRNNLSGAALVDDGGCTSIGGSSATTSGTSGVCLSGTVSNPCSAVLVSTSANGVLLGTGTGAGNLLISASTPIRIPISNTNMLYVSGGTVVVGYLWFR